MRISWIVGLPPASALPALSLFVLLWIANDLTQDESEYFLGVKYYPVLQFFEGVCGEHTNVILVSGAGKVGPDVLPFTSINRAKPGKNCWVVGSVVNDSDGGCKMAPKSYFFWPDRSLTIAMVVGSVVNDSDGYKMAPFLTWSVVHLSLIHIWRCRRRG